MRLVASLSLILLALACDSARGGSGFPAQPRPDAADGDDASAGGDATVGDVPVGDVPAIDAGARDAGSTDAGRMDAALADAGGRDAAPRDTGARDAMVSDAGGDLSCDPRFGMAQACGGNPIGRWTYATACIDDTVFAPLVMACPGVSRSNQMQRTSGTLTLTSTLTFERVLTDYVSTKVDVPAICVAIVGSCTSVAGAITTAIPQASASCLSNAAMGCDCDVVIDRRLVDRGTWTTSGNRVIVTPAGGNPQGYHYCVDRDVLKYHGESAGTIDNAVTYVLTR